jgi:hypothetical protein
LVRSARTLSRSNVIMRTCTTSTGSCTWRQESGFVSRVGGRRRAIKYLATVFPFGNYENREIWKEYLPQVVPLWKIEQGKDMREKYTLFLKVGQCLLKDARTREAVIWLENSYQWRKRNLPENHSDRLDSQHELPTAYRANG